MAEAGAAASSSHRVCGRTAKVPRAADCAAPCRPEPARRCSVSCRVFPVASYLSCGTNRYMIGRAALIASYLLCAHKVRAQSPLARRPGLSPRPRHYVRWRGARRAFLFGDAMRGSPRAPGTDPEPETPESKSRALRHLKAELVPVRSRTLSPGNRLCSTIRTKGSRSGAGRSSKPVSVSAHAYRPGLIRGMGELRDGMTGSRGTANRALGELRGPSLYFLTRLDGAVARNGKPRLDCGVGANALQVLH